MVAWLGLGVWQNDGMFWNQMAVLVAQLSEYPKNHLIVTLRG